MTSAQEHIGEIIASFQASKCPIWQLFNLLTHTAETTKPIEEKPISYRCDDGFCVIIKEYFQFGDVIITKSVYTNYDKDFVATGTETTWIIIAGDNVYDCTWYELPRISKKALYHHNQTQVEDNYKIKTSN